jgi:predicted flap endonuclease-1-like 5' DNA nuclease
LKEELVVAKLSIIEGVGESYEIKLKEAGITSVASLLNACAAKKDRTALAKKAGITEKLVLKWANHADLMRIKGIGGEYAELLEAAGVDTVPELAKRKAEALVTKLASANEAKKLVRKMPTAKQVQDWIKQAGELPRVMKY